MAKVILEFDYYEDQESLKYAQHGPDYHAALHELDQYLRARLKYEDLSEPVDEALQLVRDKLHELVSDCGGL